MRRRHVFAGQERPAQGGHLDVAVAHERLGQHVDRGRVDEGLVALDVDDDLAGQQGGNLGQPIGAGGVIGTRQPRDAAEALHRVDDPLVVGGHDHGIHRGPRRAAVDVLDHGAAVDVSERFSGKAGGVVARRDDRDDRRFRQSGRQSAWNSGHGE